MTRDARIALLLMVELTAALRANEPYALRTLLSEGIQKLGATEAQELLLGWHLVENLHQMGEKTR